MLLNGAAVYGVLQASAKEGKMQLLYILYKEFDSNSGEIAMHPYSKGEAREARDQNVMHYTHHSLEPSEKHTRLQYAASVGHTEIGNILLEKGADVNAKPAKHGGFTALQGAASGGHTEIVNILLEKGADVNAKPSNYDGFLALQGAASKGHTDIVNILLEEGADVNTKPACFGGFIALESAASGGHTDIVDILLEKGAESTL